MWPMIVLNSRDMMTIQVGLSTFQYQYNTQYGPDVYKRQTEMA